MSKAPGPTSPTLFSLSLHKQTHTHADTQSYDSSKTSKSLTPGEIICPENGLNQEYDSVHADTHYIIKG